MSKGYDLAYTLKNPKEGEPLYHYDSFASKEEAEQFVTRNEAKIYWHQITKAAARSEKPKPIIGDITGIEDYKKMTGTLQTYYETGMECLGLTFNEDGIHGPPNPNFDPSKPEDRNNFKNYSSYDALHFLASGQILEIDGTMIGLVKDRQFAKDDGYRLSFYPQGFSRLELIKLFQSETVKAVLYVPKKDLVK